MSLNLTMHDGEDGPSIDLWQTPTHITKMCLSYDPVTGTPDGGHQAVLKRYIWWVESRLNGAWRPDDLEQEQENIRLHVEAISAVRDPFFSYV